MQQTGNYQLSQWEMTDRIQMEDFNGDNAKIDAALAAETAAREALAATVAKCGNCKLEIFNYTGTGAYQNSFTFAKTPLLFFIQGETSFMIGAYASGRVTAIVKDTQSSSTYVSGMALAWNGSQAMFSALSANYAMNLSGQTYWVFAIYEEDA